MPCLGKAKQIFHPKQNRLHISKTILRLATVPHTAITTINLTAFAPGCLLKSHSKHRHYPVYGTVHRNRRHINSLAQIFNSHFHSWQFYFFSLGNRRPSPSIIVTLKIQPSHLVVCKFLKGGLCAINPSRKWTVPPPVTVQK